MTVVNRDPTQSMLILVSGSDVNGNNANTDFTSDAIPMTDNPWSLVFTFTSLTVSGQYPTLEIQGSNDYSKGSDSWETISNGSATSLPRAFKSRYCEFLFIRLVYLSNGATAGTINVFINQVMK